jgi:hypothetical protein
MQWYWLKGSIKANKAWKRINIEQKLEQCSQKRIDHLKKQKMERKGQKAIIWENQREILTF